MPMKAYLSAISVAIIVVAAIVISTGFRSVGIARGQGNLTNGNETIGNMTLTPEQKDAICNPNNPLSRLNPVNTTESKICGIPKTLNATSTTSNTTTGEEAPPTSSSIAPSANTTTGEETPPTNLAPSAAPPPGE
jgi:hypothetical protein